MTTTKRAIAIDVPIRLNNSSRAFATTTTTNVCVYFAARECVLCTHLHTHREMRWYVAAAAAVCVCDSVGLMFLCICSGGVANGRVFRAFGEHQREYAFDEGRGGARRWKAI